MLTILRFLAVARMARMAATAMVIACVASLSQAQMVSGAKMPGYGVTLGLDADRESKTYKAQFIEGSAPGNVLWPGEQASFTFQIVNLSNEAIACDGTVEVIAYGTKGRPGDIWVPDMFKIGDSDAPQSAIRNPQSAILCPVRANVAVKGFQNLTVTPKTPERFGAYTLVVDLGKNGRRFVTSYVRTFKPAEIPVQYPQLALDVSDVNVLKRLGGFPNRIGIGYKPTTDKDFDAWFQKEAAKLEEFKKANLPITLEIGCGAWKAPEQPLQHERPWLDDKGVMKDGKSDIAWMPSYDEDFKKFTKMFVTKYGWPKGPINGIKLWNEPWEGISISGWGADMIRYREIFLALCVATRNACQEAGVQVLIGGCDSSSNTFDKLFADGSDDFLKYLDFVSIHYQGMAPPSTVKAWVDRKSPNGRVRVWDTESWVANCDDRVAAVIATNLSTGHDRAVGIYGGNICTEWHSTGADMLTEGGKKKRINVTHTWSVAASVGAANYFIGERRFKELLFKNGLPWVMIFNGLPGGDGKPNPEDGTIVVVGDIGEEFGADSVLFRTARGLKEMAHKAELKKELAALPVDGETNATTSPTANAKKRQELEKQIRKLEPLSGAMMTLSASGDRFSLYDFYGNPVPSQDGKIIVPLDHRGFFLRADGGPDSFAALVEAVRSSRVAGIEPLATVCHDMTAPIAGKPALRLELTNVLNRKIKGNLEVSLGALKIEAPASLAFDANETKQVEVMVVAGEAAPGNVYPLKLRFDAGKDGAAEHEEDMHVNFIVRRTIKVDGQLDDWKDVLPQIIAPPDASGPTLTEAAWFPFKNFDASAKKGLATGYLAYDSDNFYIVVKAADDTPDEGMPRFETLGDEEFFYPEVSYSKPKEGQKELKWPEGVRRYSYRKGPELPAGNAPNHDNVQIAFNVLPAAAKPAYPCPPGTMPGYIAYSDTDYEYALNPVAQKYGGGEEIWRLAVPGMPHKHFYPRQPKSPFDGPVKKGQLKFRRDGSTRIVEAAIPWSEIPEVKKRLDLGQPIKFSFRVNDNAGGGCMELSRNRSVAKRNASFHVDWAEHWANELEFGFER
ncbi:MAG: hypothetical protein NTX50_27340 [Candidatus Sumerlaeota bacterium]|nr:hypothetical protein [Candidatus Sumerlaeota bacterium]